MFPKLFFLLGFICSLVSGDIGVSLISYGVSGKPVSSGNMVIREEKEFKHIWDKLGIEGEIPSVDFSREVVLVIVPSTKVGGVVRIKAVEVKEDALVEVRFALKPYTSGSEYLGKGYLPYLVAKIFPVDVRKTKIRFIEDIWLPPVTVNSGIGQVPAYTDALRVYENMSMFDFFPLDKGNSWTYKVESGGEVREETYSVLYVSQDGWSVFDTFFGLRDVGLRVDPFGDVFVSVNGDAKSFYTPAVQRYLTKETFVTPAGKFDNLVVVTIPKNNRFWFRDVYAKGIGLIYHEHISDGNSVKYTLKRAKIRGKSYP
ncbi:MAG: hypothetical protein KatS3mg078_1750 [Deltaproteobacteria bacterium]|jgi:hypothetical protein|nr:MAG: hypothetical protein KatS3mg078_1750 [Deltaproteobacteria bacterium]